MNFWNQLIGEPIQGTVKTKMKLHKFACKQIIDFVQKGILTREEVIDSGVIESMFTHELRDYIYPRGLHEAEVTEILNRRYEDKLLADKLNTDSGENP